MESDHLSIFILFLDFGNYLSFSQIAFVFNAVRKLNLSFIKILHFFRLALVFW